MNNRRGGRRNNYNANNSGNFSTPAKANNYDNNKVVTPQQGGNNDSNNTYVKPAPVEAPPPPEIKDELITSVTESVSDEVVEGAEGEKKSRWFGMKKKPIRRKDKRMRQNRRLRKMLAPKTALMALNELFGAQASEYNVHGNSNSFTAEITLNGKRFIGNGQSKTAAKNDASEKALRDIVIDKLAKFPKSDLTSFPARSAAANDEGGDVEMVDGEDKGEEEDVPMIHLASFALYKLFNEWENDGYKIPDFRSNGPSNVVPMEVIKPESGEKKTIQHKMRTELPPNADTTHPCMLLAMMRPGLSYNDLGSEGTTPSVIHKVGITVDEQVFIGEGKSKKIARKSVAEAACRELFGVNYVEKIDISDM